MHITNDNLAFHVFVDYFLAIISLKFIILHFVKNLLSGLKHRDMGKSRPLTKKTILIE